MRRCLPTWTSITLSVVCLVVWPPAGASTASTPLGHGKYCQERQGVHCCKGRQDDCGAPIHGTVCYCDDFCNRIRNEDCCPDFWTYCKNQEPPTPSPAPYLSCYYQGRYLNLGETLRLNCNKCTCRIINPTEAQMVCDDRDCVIRPDVIDYVNRGDFGWRASNYSFLWGKTLDEGVNAYLGACQPDKQVASQHSIPVIADPEPLPEEFDSRRKWSGLIRTIKDQGNYPASWAISTIDVVSDRLAIQSGGHRRTDFSIQQLVSCDVRRPDSCKGGYTGRAWRYIYAHGVVSEECYGYTSGTTGERGTCQVPRRSADGRSDCPTSGQRGAAYRSPPAYRIPSNERDIMMEIRRNGPVQALLKLGEDFFMYRMGVYRYSDPRLANLNKMSGYHAVRIIGWGVARTPSGNLKYWTCANSWGKNWGEDGYFRIIRGENESEVENFVVSVWAATESAANTQTAGNRVRSFETDLDNGLNTFGNSNLHR